MTMRPVALVVMVLALCTAGLAWAQDLGNAQTSGPLRVEWESRQTGGGRAVVSGYVQNRHTMRVEHIRLRVDTLDASSRPTSTRTVYLTGTLSSQSRGYFEARVPGGEGTYRVTVDSFAWSGCGDG